MYWNQQLAQKHSRNWVTNFKTKPLLKSDGLSIIGLIDPLTSKCRSCNLKPTDPQELVDDRIFEFISNKKLFETLPPPVFVHFQKFPSGRYPVDINQRGKTYVYIYTLYYSLYYIHILCVYIPCIVIHIYHV